MACRVHHTQTDVMVNTGRWANTFIAGHVLQTYATLQNTHSDMRGTWHHSTSGSDAHTLTVTSRIENVDSWHRFTTSPRVYAHRAPIIPPRGALCNGRPLLAVVCMCGKPLLGSMVNCTLVKAWLIHWAAIVSAAHMSWPV